MRTNIGKVSVKLWTILMIAVLASQVLIGGRLVSFTAPFFASAANRENGEWVDFGFTGSEQSYSLQAGKLYEIESWGGNGGDGAMGYSDEDETNKDGGGLGGFSAGYVVVDKDTEIYITVGGRGADRIYVEGITLGGYNGGGDSGERTSGSGAEQGGSGGGATHIAIQRGLLASLRESKNSIIMVAGAGGGSGGLRNDGGDGGGYIGMKGSLGTAEGGTQTNGGATGFINEAEIKGYPSSFGIGAQGNTRDLGYKVAGAGGGAGWYGGGGGEASTGSGANGSSYGGYGGAGGSSYVQTPNTLDALDITPDVYLYSGFTASAEDSGFVDNPDVDGNGHARVREVTGKTAVLARFEQSDNSTGVLGEVSTEEYKIFAQVVESGAAQELQFKIGDFSKVERMDISGTEVILPEQNGGVSEQTVTGVGKVTLTNVEGREVVRVKLEEMQGSSVKLTAKLSHTVRVVADKESGWVTNLGDSYEVMVSNGGSFDSTKIEGWTAEHAGYAGFEIPSMEIFGYTVLDVSDYAVDKSSQGAPEFERTIIDVVFGEDDNQLQLVAKGGNEGIVYEMKLGVGTVSAEGLVSIEGLGTIEVIAFRAETATMSASSATTITIHVEQREPGGNGGEKDDQRIGKEIFIIVGVVLGSALFVGLVLLYKKTNSRSKRR